MRRSSTSPEQPQTRSREGRRTTAMPGTAARGRARSRAAQHCRSWSRQGSRSCSKTIVLRRTAAPQDVSKAVEIEVDNRRRVERQKLREEQTADDRVAERLAE